MWFTPTRVGNTQRRASSTRPRPAVHPHTRGEYYFAAGSTIRINGSPPHAWGILVAGRRVVGRLRFTPTRVGNTRPSSPRCRTVCGSPPHAWGIRARASAFAASISVHPHTRGEYSSCSTRCKSGDWFTPHAWGIRVTSRRLVAEVRFTPTRVGNTRNRGRPNPRPTVHPHTRGEYCGDGVFAKAFAGSPPHAWGIR